MTTDTALLVNDLQETVARSKREGELIKTSAEHIVYLGNRIKQLEAERTHMVKYSTHQAAVERAERAEERAESSDMKLRDLQQEVDDNWMPRHVWERIKAQRDALLKDKARLDWLQANVMAKRGDVLSWTVYGHDGENVRAAIDSAARLSQRNSDGG